MQSYSRVLMAGMLIWMSCIDKVNLSLPASQLPIVMEGLVTDQNERYVVRISKAYPIDGGYYTGLGVVGASVTITSSAGESVDLDYLEDGKYVTDSTVLRGQVGRTYQLHVTMPDGSTYESLPETIVPSGTIDDIFTEYVVVHNKQTGVEENGFNVYLDATLPPGSSHRMRWQYNGTYKVFTNPAALLIPVPCNDPVCPMLPPACAEGCLCCTCWVPEREKSPIVSTAKFQGTDQLDRMFIHFIPINNYTFNEKYRVEIAQMEVSQVVYDFYSGIKGQMENASSLFQPPFFELKGNVQAVNNQKPVVGIFSAAAVTKRHIYILRSAIPYDLVYSEIIGDCRAVAPYSSTTMPVFWE